MLKWISKKRNQKGFTLIELVVVIAILGILAAIAIPRLGKSRETAKIATHNSNVRILKSAAAMWIADNPTEGEEKTLLEDGEGELLEYLDGGEAPEVPKGVEKIEGDAYEVTIDAAGSITVTPDAVGEETKTDPKP